MNKEEYIELVESNKELNNRYEVVSSINAMSDILITKGICTKDEIVKLKDKNKKLLINNAYKNENQEDLKNAKTINDFFKMFGGNQ